VYIHVGTDFNSRYIAPSLVQSQLLTRQIHIIVTEVTQIRVINRCSFHPVKPLVFPCTLLWDSRNITSNSLYHFGPSPHQKFRVGPSLL